MEDLGVRDAISPLSLFLMLFGICAFVYGILLFPIMSGDLPYDAEGAQAIFLIVFAVMIAFLGITPLGALHHSRLVFALGLLLVVPGTLAYMSPTLILTRWVDYALGSVLIIMGLVHIPDLLVNRPKRIPPLSSGSVILYTIMYLICIGLGILNFFSASDYLSAVLLILLGIVQFTLGLHLSRTHSGGINEGHLFSSWGTGSSHPLMKNVDLPMKSMVTLFLAVITLVMALFSFAGLTDVVPFDSQRTSILLMFVLALQVMLAGETPIGDFEPSRWLVGLGMVLAVLSMVACIVPGLLEQSFAVVLGIADLVTALSGFIQLARSMRKTRKTPDGDARATSSILVASGTFYVLLLFFAVDHLLPNFVPEAVMAVVFLLAGISMIRLVVLEQRHDNPDQ